MSEPVFLASLPNSGSTMLQRMLANHSQIETQPEPWIYLPFLAALDPHLTQSAFRSDLAATHVEKYLASIGRSQDELLRGIGESIKALHPQSDSRYYLDKTPRYYMILKQLRAALPEAPIILLIRNPIAIYTSVAKRFKSRGFQYSSTAYDLFRGPALVAEAIALPNTIAVRYEDLCSQPQEEIARILKLLDIPFEPACLSSEFKGFEDQWGDKSGNVARFDSPQKRDPLSHLATVDSRTLKQDLRQYLKFLGPETLSNLGYDYQEQHDALENKAAWKPDFGIVRYGRLFDNYAAN